MADYGDQDRQCPFYKNTVTGGRVAIICEGLISDTTRHNFLGYRELLAHRERYCDDADLFCLCPHAVALFEKHEYNPPNKTRRPSG